MRDVGEIPFPHKGSKGSKAPGSEAPQSYGSFCESIRLGLLQS